MKTIHTQWWWWSQWWWRWWQSQWWWWLWWHNWGRVQKHVVTIIEYSYAQKRLSIRLIDKLKLEVNDWVGMGGGGGGGGWVPKLPRPRAPHPPNLPQVQSTQIISNHCHSTPVKRRRDTDTKLPRTGNTIPDDEWKYDLWNNRNPNDCRRMIKAAAGPQIRMVMPRKYDFCLGGNWEAAPYRNPFLHRGTWLSLASQGPSRVM